MRSMVEGVRLRNAPSPFPHHRASRGPPPPPCGGGYPPYATLTLTVFVVSLPRMSMTLTTIV
jgi:hypothetical protein